VGQVQLDRTLCSYFPLAEIYKNELERVVAYGDASRFNWDSLVPYLIHPVKVAIIEAMEWIEVPVSPRELDRVFDEKYGLSLVSYHMRTLADVGVVEKVRQQSVRGALQTFYSLSAMEPASPSLSCE
jgi:DNA-binding transcriptional ArsR family regulator